MRNFTVLIVLMILILTYSCEDNRVPSGIDAYIYWAECDTMQAFLKYDGMVYFVPSARFNEVNDSTWNSIKTTFDSSLCYNGFLSDFLEPGEYIAEPDTFINILSPEIFIVEPDLLKKVEIRFVYCQ